MPTGTSLAFYGDVENLKSCTHACTADNLPAEPSTQPQPHFSFLRKKYCLKDSVFICE